MLVLCALLKKKHARKEGLGLIDKNIKKNNHYNFNQKDKGKHSVSLTRLNTMFCLCFKFHLAHLQYSVLLLFASYNFCHKLT